MTEQELRDQYAIFYRTKTKKEKEHTKPSDIFIAGYNLAQETIEKLEKEKESIRDFALDYQLWVKDFLIGLDVKDNFCFMTFQGMRKQAYTHAKTRGEKPKWGDESYFDNQFGKLTTLEETIKAKDEEIESLKGAYSIVADANTEKLFELEKKDQAIAEARGIIRTSLSFNGIKTQIEENQNAKKH